MALTLRKQPGRMLLLILAGTSLVLFFLNQSDLSTPFAIQPAPHMQATPYSHRRIQDYNSPEYTAPGETGGETALGTARDVDREEHPKDDLGRLRAPLDPTPPATNGGSPSSDPESTHTQDTIASDTEAVEQDAIKAIIEEIGPYDGQEEEEEAEEEEEIENVILKVQKTKDEISIDDAKPAANDDDPPGTREVVGQEAKDGVVGEKVNDGITSDNNSERNKDARTTDPDDARDKEVGGKEDAGVPSERKTPSWIDGIRPATKHGFIDTLVEKQREVLAEAMQGYTFHRTLKAKKMEDLVLEHGGRPVRSIVITTWRSGSTFIGDVLQSHPATYYHYEPLLDFGINQVRHGELAKQAIHNLRHLLTCNYTDMDQYLEYGPQHPWLFSHNTRLWYYCTNFPEHCWNPDFLSPFCSLFPFQSLKTVRLRLNLTREFLLDKSLGVQVLLLVRDPRGTMQSRRHREWCPGNPDCDDPVKLCNDLVSDYNTAIDFRRKFPHSFRVVRYEDLSFDAYNMTRELFNFFHLSYHPRVQEFLDTHTKEKIGGVSSTFRNSKTAPVHWQQDLDWQDVETIQRVCSKALKLWGYEIATDEKHLRSFKPVGIFKFR